MPPQVYVCGTTCRIKRNAVKDGHLSANEQQYRLSGWCSTTMSLPVQQIYCKLSACPTTAYLVEKCCSKTAELHWLLPNSRELPMVLHRFNQSQSNISILQVQVAAQTHVFPMPLFIQLSFYFFIFDVSIAFGSFVLSLSVCQCGTGTQAFITLSLRVIIVILGQATAADDLDDKWSSCGHWLTDWLTNVCCREAVKPIMQNTHQPCSQSMAQHHYPIYCLSFPLISFFSSLVSPQWASIAGINYHQLLPFCLDA